MDSKKQKGIFGGPLTFFGYGIVLFLFFISSVGIAETWGGAEAMLDELSDDPEFRENFLWHHVAFDMITPLYPVEFMGMEFNIALDDGGFMFILLLAFMTSVVLVKVVFRVSWWFMIIAFPMMILIVGFVWQNYWLAVYFTTGQNMGMSIDELVNTLSSTQNLTSNPIILGAIVFSMMFLLFKGKGLFRS